MEIRKVAIIGAGLMGSSIAYVVATAGYDVTLRSRRGRKNGLSRLNEEFQKAKNRKILSEEQASQLLSKIKYTSSLSRAVKTADLVIETVVEDLAIKKEIFRQVATHCSKHCILASNTSSLSITSLAEEIEQVDKVVGLHFFNPAPVMNLVEIIKTTSTSIETVDTVLNFLEKIGKAPLIVIDSPGFIVNRILMRMINAAAYTLMDQVASAETIDSAMKLGTNQPMGPLALADLVGIDVCFGILKELKGRLRNEDFAICPLFEKMIAEGNLGRKTGKGFFSYRTR